MACHSQKTQLIIDFIGFFNIITIKSSDIILHNI